MSDTGDTFCKKMRKATREIHALSDSLVNAKLAFGFMDDSVWADGLLVFYEIFRYLEGAMIRLENTKVGQLRLPGLERTEAFEEDLRYYLGNDWLRTYTPRESVVKYLMRLREVEDTDSLLLMAYIYHLYMGLLSGGIILRKKRQIVQKIAPFQDQQHSAGNRVTNFGDYNVYELKREMRETMNRIADTIDEDTKNKLIEESKTVYILNNELIRSVRGAGIVIIKRVIYFVSAVVFFLFVFLVLLKQ